MEPNLNPNDTVCLARQPIFNARMEVVAYELLFRGLDSEKERLNASDRGDTATSAVLNNVFSEIGLETVTGGHPAFINCTRNWLLNDTLSALPPQQIVIEILEDISIDDAVIQAIGRLKKAGYRIALDDFVFSPEWAPLLAQADIIKYDVMQTPLEQLPALIEQLKPYKVEFLAEKIESHAVFNACIRLGFSYFQGYFLCKPKLITGKKIPGNRMLLMRIFQELGADNVDIEKVSHIMHQDARLGYKLLKMVNSPMYGLRKKIESVKEAIVLLGLSKVKQTIQLLLLGLQEDVPHELLVTSLMRGKMMEIIGKKMQYPHPERCFTVGLFSTIDALLDEPMDSLLKHLPLSDDITMALIEKSGQMGHFLQACLQYEYGEWSENGPPIALELSELHEAYWQSVPWAVAASGVIHSSATS